MRSFIRSIESSPIMFLTIVGYLALMVFIGIWAHHVSKRGSHEGTKGFMEDYFLAGRGMGGLTLAMSIITTYTSASSFIGGPGVAYSLGLGWVLLAMIQVPTSFLTLGIMGRRLSRYSRETGAVTISDFLRARYGSRSLVFVTSFFMIVFFLAVMLAQFIGGARVLEATTGAPYSAGLFLFAVTVILYTSIGGFRAVIITDLLQGFIMLVAAVAVLLVVIKTGGGLAEIFQKMREIDPGLLKPTGAGNKIPVPFMLSFWILVGLGVLGLPQTAQKCMAFTSDAAMKQAMVVGTMVIGFILLCTHLTGALGRAIIPDLPAGDLVMPTLIVELMPPFVAGLFIAGVLAAIMSTVSSMLIMTSATLISDLYIEWKLQGKKEMANQRIVRIASLAITAVLGVFVAILAIHPPDLLVWINLFAFGGLEAVFLWPVVLGLYWDKANATGAMAAVLTGVLCFLSISIGKPALWGIHPIVPSLVTSGLAFLVANKVS